jgi:protein TonB
MTLTLQNFSPKSSSGSFLISVGIHCAIYGILVWLLSVHFSTPLPKEDYVDLGYQTFDEPPVPAKEIQRVVKAPDPVTPVDTKIQPDNSPKELQDEKGVVTGTQAAEKPVNTGADTTGTANATPYYKIKPKYPQAALVSGTEGWVMLQIDITETGAVENIRVVDGEQRNLFQNEARRAVAQWKYRPFVDANGRPYRKSDYQLRVNFTLQEQDSGS